MIMIWSVTLVLVISVGEISGGCPIRCNCTDNSVTCASKDLEYVPYFEDLDNIPAIIDLSGTTINLIDIDDFSFDKSDQVVEIYLNNSAVTIIEPKAFDELENLQELYLGDNLLNSVPEDIIANNYNMIVLDLSSNYFTDMPTIKSERLEVLAIANSGMLKIADHALQNLPSLRMLLIQQNNLKVINPAAFRRLQNLLMIRLDFNPWFCNCKTVQLFDYLNNRSIIDITNPVQCQTTEKTFINIYTSIGPIGKLKQQCEGTHLPLDESLEKDKTWEMEELLLESEGSENIQTAHVNWTENTLEGNYVVFTNFYYSLVLGVAIILSLVTGAVCGSCLTYSYIHKNMKETHSMKQLLSNTNQYVP